MKWASAVSRNASIEEAVDECAVALAEELGDEVSLVCAFVTPHFAAYYEEIHALLSRTLDVGVFVGCSGGGVIGGGEEVEREPALSLVAATLPGVEISPLRLSGPLPDPDAPPEEWGRLLGIERPAEIGGETHGETRAETPQFVLLSDPFSFRTGAFLEGLDYAFPSSPKVGGLASGGTSPGTNALFLDGETFTEGLVGVSLAGDIVADTVVAQGCRPIGETMMVTACVGNALYELDGRPALEVVQETLSSLESRDVALARSALFVGVLMDEFAPDPGAGEFLIRNVLGADPARGALAVGERLQEGMRLRFHVRDAETSSEDLRRLLETYASSPAASEVRGALFFSCLGRGEGLYGTPDFDSNLFADILEDLPNGGFFCNGEIGPVGGSTFLHGYTSSFALFRPRV